MPDDGSRARAIVAHPDDMEDDMEDGVPAAVAFELIGM